MTRDDRLPRDAQSILELAARSMFDLFATASEGMMLVDRKARVVWINDQYRRFLPALGFEREEDFVGYPVSSVVQNTQMHQVLATGKPILIDLLTNKAGTFVVSRIPLRDDAGEVIGVLGIVLFDHPETTLQPLIAKFARLEQDLSDARRELASQRRSKYTFASFVGTSTGALEVKRQARRAASSSSPVLLLGETGTGKELLAHAIHASSPRAGRPFVSVNMAAVPDTLLEAEFFGVAPGAYTGADKKGRDGKFKLADGGTLFLDELGDMPMSVQVKLLRALQEGEIEPLGSNKLVRFDVRVVAVPSWKSAPRPRPCWRPRPGAATSASCATCWNSWPCAATRRTSTPRRWSRCCARPGWTASNPPWPGRRGRRARRRAKPICGPCPSRSPSWSAGRSRSPWPAPVATARPRPGCWASRGPAFTTSWRAWKWRLNYGQLSSNQTRRARRCCLNFRRHQEGLIKIPCESRPVCPGTDPAMRKTRRHAL